MKTIEKFLNDLINFLADLFNSEIIKILGISFIPCIIVCVYMINFAVKTTAEKISSNYPYELSVRHRDNVLHMQQVKCDLVDEVDNYIKKIAPSSCLNALTLVDACSKYDIDILFVLAQGHIESHYGTRGIAAKTNSVFNVHSFDGLSANQILESGKGYRHPDFSIEPYLKLLKNHYLVNGKTERDLFNEFVDSDGCRYASAENYEQQMLEAYTKIQTNTKIDSLVSEYQKYKIITYHK